jgi:hypothetical protein
MFSDSPKLSVFLSSKSSKGMSEVTIWLNVKGKVLKQPPKYERMVAWHIYRNAQDVKTQRVGL